MPSFKSYLIGFLLSIALTLAAFYPVHQHVVSNHIAFSHEFLYPFLAILVFIQAVVQLIFFLHLMHTSRWSKIVFASTLSIIFIFVVGSIWIMSHLNYNMTPAYMDKYMMQTEGMSK